MRDYSEYYELNKEDIKMVSSTWGVMIGKDFDSMEEALISGIYYERGELLEALHHALNACRALEDGMHPETVFSANMVLASTLYALGASQEADGAMSRMDKYINAKALFLHPNFAALRTERLIRADDLGAAKEWLTVYANYSSRLQFYQICRHFTTMRSFIALGDYASAVAFGNRLQTLAEEYCRPLDRIESGLLTAIALWKNNQKKKAIVQLEQAAAAAKPYGFTQLFINEGLELLPMLWELQEKAGKSAGFARFVNGLAQEICKKHKLKPTNETMPELTAQQRAMLPYLSRSMTYKEIADASGIGRATVKYHVLRVYKQLGVNNAQDAVLRAKMLGML
jgi:LuxR family maltose regulon positive regulatory protein